MFKNLRQLLVFLLFSVALLGVSGTGVFAQTVPDPFPWPMFLPGIINGTGTSGTPPPVKQTYWSAMSFAVCPDSVATFSLTSEGVTQKSVMPAGGNLSTFEGWVMTTPGLKSFRWNFSAGTCGTGGNTFTYNLEENKNYAFQLDVDSNGSPFVQVVIGNGIP